MRTYLLFVVLIASFWMLPLSAASAQSNAASADKPHFHSHPHDTELNAARFDTNRTSPVELPLPRNEEAFVFGVFGDRTGGPDEGVEILRDAVEDINLFEPDLVMTVGDLIQGYNTRDRWMPQMREYKSIMSDLLCPWFPVAGNHDVYYRGPNRPAEEHEGNYEIHFGPLWYAFEHKNCWFIVLYSDEGNPETGERNFNKPECQKMSPEQFGWLKSTLEKAKDATHVFLFLHHPRWLGNNYGNDWDKVHRALVDAGNVRAVFGGHIHRMRYDGPKDGIEYVTLATVGGGQSGISADAGFLHHYHLVTVRDNQIAMACVPVGEVMDVREVTGEISDQIELLARTPPSFGRCPRCNVNGVSDVPLVVNIQNPTDRPVEFETVIDAPDHLWLATPDHQHITLPANSSAQLAFDIRRIDTNYDDRFRFPQLVVNADYLGAKRRFSLSERSFPIPVRIDIPPSDRRLANSAAKISTDNCFRVDSAVLNLPNGPMTLECWFKANSYPERVAVVAKTQGSEYGLFVSNGVPYFTIFLGDRYVEPQPSQPLLEIEKWHHLAGVFDGEEVRTYLDGKLVSQQAGKGKRRTNGLPLIIGADVDARGANSFFDGQVDAVRVSSVARYHTDSFEPAKRWQADEDTRLLLNFDRIVATFAVDESESGAHATMMGQPEVVPVGN